jgi:hypothetical protein
MDPGVRQDDAAARAALRGRTDGVVIPAQAGIHFQADSNVKMDLGVRQDDAAANCVTFGRISSP